MEKISENGKVAEQKPYAFLSSLTDDFGGWLADGSLDKNSLRYQAFELGQELGRTVWVAEVFRSELTPTNFRDLEIADALWENVRTCEVFICLLGAREKRPASREHGTLIQFGERVSAVSFFEAELALAALLGKPIYLFIEKGFSPGPRMSALLDLLSFAIPASFRYEGQSRSEILAGIQGIITERKRSNWNVAARLFHNPRLVAGKLLSKAYQDRGIRNGRPRGSREILFLDGMGEKRSTLPDKDLVKELLLTERTSPNAEAKLVRLWIAIRELMACPPEQDETGDYLLLWNEVLSRWASNAAWYGLHGHIYAGQLAALFSASRVRQRLRETGSANLEPSQIQHPGGVASALYSMAKLMPSRAERREVLLDGFEHLNKTISERGAPDANLLQLRGSFYLRMRARRLAVADYETALVLREKAGSSEGQIGESMSELGFAYLFEGRLLRGFDLLQRGAEMLSNEKETKAGFYARALKKLAIGYAVRGQFFKAKRALVESRQIATKQRMFDQL